MSICTSRVYLLAALVALSFAAVAAASAQVIAIRADTIYTMAGPVIVDGIAIIRDGKIEQVGPAASIAIPSGAQVLTASVVTPGLVDARSSVGLSGFTNQDQDQDALDTGGAIQPSLRAMDAYNARDELVDWLLSFGVTTVQTGHRAGALAAGQTVIVKTAYPTVDQALVDSTAMLAMTLGGGVRANFSSSVGTRARAVSELRRALIAAQEYDVKRKLRDVTKRPARDLDKDILADVAEGRMPALLTAHAANDILTVLRLKREFPKMNLILDGASEAYLVVGEILAANVPVILHPTMYRASGEAANISFETASVLERAGIPFAIQSGFESYVPKTRVILFEAAVAAGHGLSRMGALKSITIDAARIIGVDSRVGSIEAGKDADLVLYDGDPLETTTRVCAVVVDGKVVRDECF